jgi:Co/Zn/Cd efflux system component
VNKSYYRNLAIITILLLTTLACRPVFTVGWWEMGILFVLAIFLVGPLLFKIYRFIERFREAANASDKGDKGKKQ